MKIPAISAIVSLYNTEKYIGECLDSILAQTFQDFEVVVVDDCSTDGSPAIVESFIPKFGERLKIFRLKKNSGNNGIPNNTGLALSRGEYVIFLDSDDTITIDAFEKLYSVAKNFNADVVACDRYFDVPAESWYDAEFRKQLTPVSYQQGDFVNEPTLITENFSERVKACSQMKFLWNIWSKLIRRDFLIENKITVTNEMANDMLLSCFLAYSAKRYVRVPYAVNFYRVVENSLTHRRREPLKQLEKYMKALTVGFAHLDKFLREQEFFQQNPDAKYMAFDTYFREILLYLDEIYFKIPVSALDDTLRKIFSKADNTAFMAFTFSAMNLYRLELIQIKNRVDEQKNIERRDKAYISELEKFILDSQRRIAALEGEIKHKE